MNKRRDGDAGCEGGWRAGASLHRPEEAAQGSAWAAHHCLVQTWLSGSNLFFSERPESSKGPGNTPAGTGQLPSYGLVVAAEEGAEC